ncbi:hypothetical protein BB987_19910 [Photorhabdus temperata]|uniref:Uncharacterized protein n=2 Tax=Photorhabdus TaxID=29487 RepID=A0A7X5QNF6_9GAMM|nr:hypothetical protein PTE_02220 [Photorhabdus khanii NC19]NHB97568.1 hypothetical protein [Photorhabdus stackebrandtii]OHV49028.1 hypothetical protein BB987_19910 [Photorhabdus temperata]
MFKKFSYFCKCCKRMKYFNECLKRSSSVTRNDTNKVSSLARIPYLCTDKDDDLFAISISQNDLFEEGATMVVNKQGKGNGFFSY